MKSILISKPPKIVANVLNGLASILILKTCPKDWKDYLSGKTKEMPEPTDVYIYCTKDKEKLVYVDYTPCGDKGYITTDLDCENEEINGLVVAKFTLNKVEEISPLEKNDILLKKACLSIDELFDYLISPISLNVKTGYAWHISNLVIFDKPKELWQFKTPKEAVRYSKELNQAYKDDARIRERLYEGLAEDNECANAVQLTELTEYIYGLQKAPQSWCYVEVAK